MMSKKEERTVKAKKPEPTERRPTDPLMRAADAALRRAATKAQDRARAIDANSKPLVGRSNLV